MIPEVGLTEANPPAGAHVRFNTVSNPCHTCVEEEKNPSEPNHYLRWRVLEVAPHNGRPFHRACGRPFEIGHRPCGGHNKRQGFFGHHNNLLVGHRTGGHHTLQAFSHHIPSGAEETWGADVLRIRSADSEVSVNDHGGNRDHHAHNVRRVGRGRLCGLHAVHRDDSCRGQHAEDKIERYLSENIPRSINIPQYPEQLEQVVLEGPCHQVL